MSKPKVIIKSEKDLGAFLTELTRRVALRRIGVLLENEEDVQDALVAQLNDLKSDGPAEDLEEDDTEDADVDVSADDAEDVEEVSPQTIIEKLNTIRSGHSLKRSDIRDQMEEYIDALDDAEKVALNAFLEGIAAIITGAEEGAEAEEPSPEVKMKTKTKVVDRIRKPVKKKVVVAADEDETVAVKKKKKSKPKASAEDSTPPIKVT